MDAPAARSLTVARHVGNSVVTGAAQAWKAALCGTTWASATVFDYLRWRGRAALDDLRPYERDTVQKRKLHREAWLADLERQELELRAVPLTAREAAQEARAWAERMAAVAARYDVMRAELRDLRAFSSMQIPFDRNGQPRDAFGARHAGAPRKVA
ncbi:MAG: hypothetical protein ACLPYS_00475 [Vulcanimicrobiaceae bacterium]